MFRVCSFVLALGAAVAIHQAAARANGSSMPSPSPSSSMSSPASLTPEQQAVQIYNSGIDHKNKGLKLEADAVKQSAKDREKTLAKAKDEYGKALKDFEKTAKLLPTAHQAYNGMGFSLRKTGDAAKALEMYDKALQLAPGFPDAIEYRGEAFLALNRIDDAKKAYLDLFAKDRKQADDLMKAMTAWVARQQAAPAGVEPAAVSDLDTWIKERANLAQLTADMGVQSNQSVWR